MGKAKKEVHVTNRGLMRMPKGAKMIINGFVHQRIIDSNVREVALDIDVDNMGLIPEDASYFVFVAIDCGSPITVDEAALGSGKEINMLSDNQKKQIKDWVKANFTNEVRSTLFCI